MSVTILIVYTGLLFSQSGWKRQYSGTSNDLTNSFFTDSLHGVIVGTGGIILKTNDGGEHWYQKDVGTTNNLTFVTFINSQVGFIIGENGIILRTLDGGDTWTWQNSGITGTLQAASFYDENNGVAVGGTTVIRTTNGGQDWEILADNLHATLYRVHYFDYNNIITICDYYGSSESTVVFKSTDAGISWIQTATLRSGSRHDFTDSKFLDNNNGFILEWHGQMSMYFSHIHKTTDGGKTWSEVTANNVNLPKFYSISFGDVNRGFAVGSNNNIYKTIDGGKTWEVQLTKSKGVPLRNVVFTDQNNGIIVGDEGSIYSTKTGGINSQSTDWQVSGRSTSADFMSIQLINQKEFYCVGNSRYNLYRYDTQNMTNCVMSTTDAGKNWSNTTIWPITPYGIWMTEDGLGSIVGIRTGGYPAPNGRMYNTSDGGINWQEYLFAESLNEMGYRIAKGIYYIDNARRIIIAQYGRILYTLDGGITWTKSDSVTAWDLNDISFANDEVGYVVVDRGTLLKTTDSGISWSVLPINTGNHLYGVNFTDANNGIVVGIYGMILKTTNGGLSWNEQQSGTYNHLFKVKFDNENNGMVIGEFGTILKTSDGGKTWIREESGTSVNLNDVSIKDSIAMTVGDFGTILKKSGQITTLDCTKIPHEYFLSQNFPNPFNPGTTIEYSVPQKSQVTLKVYDLLGREITTLINEEKSVGNYSVKFDGSNLTSGIYFYKIISGNYSSIKKMIVLK
ncbi:MAG: YCF48-related protein [Melioribacteraceae bacterium]